MAIAETNGLCLECGLCCNGVIFAQGELQPEDDANRLKMLGLALLRHRKTGSGHQKFHQPCAALDGCRCQIYTARPHYCRKFECLLFKSVRQGQTTFPAARRVISRAIRQANHVRQLLQRLGEPDETVALSLRFRRVQKRFGRGPVDAQSAAVYGELTLAMHDLNVLLSRRFYPG
jgi:Fe-S-cluster containining protein